MKNKTFFRMLAVISLSFFSQKAFSQISFYRNTYPLKYDTSVCDDLVKIEVMSIKVVCNFYDSVYITDVKICDFSPGLMGLVDSVFLFSDKKVTGSASYYPTLPSCVTLPVSKWIKVGKSANFSIYILPSSKLNFVNRCAEIYVNAVSYKINSLTSPTSTQWGPLGNKKICFKKCYPVSVKLSSKNSNNRTKICESDTVFINTTYVGDKYIKEKKYYLDGKSVQKNEIDKIIMSKNPIKVKVVIKDSFDRVFSDSILLVSTPKPIVNIFAKDGVSFCNGDSVELLYLKKNDSVAWFFENKAFISNDTSLVLRKPGKYMILVDSSGCFGSDSVFIKENPLPVATINTSKRVFCIGDESSVSFFNDTNVFTWNWVLGGVRYTSKQIKIQNTTKIFLYLNSKSGCRNVFEDSVVAEDLPDKPIVQKNDSMLWSVNNPRVYSFVWCNMDKPILGENSRFFKPKVSGYYTLRVYNQNGCENESDLIVYSIKQTNSVNNIDSLRVSIYPNPAIDVVNIECRLQNGAVQLYDLNGRLLQSVPIENGKSSVYRNNLPQGIYVVHVGDFSSKIIFQ